MQITTSNQGFAPVTLDEAMRFSDMLSKSQMVPKAYQGKPEDVLVAIQWGRELGLAPLQALQNIACINGKPSVYGDAAMALVQASHTCDGVDESFEGTEGTGEYAAVCIARRKGRNPVIVRFSVNDAKRAGLWGKAGPWQAYPKRMLQMRARGFALRDAFPDVLKGLITAEEAADFPDEAKPRPIKDVTPLPANPLDMIPPPAPAPEPAPVDFEYVPDLDEINSELQNAAAESAEPAAEPAVVGEFVLYVPGKAGDQEEPRIKSAHASLEEWILAYEALAEKTLTAGKAPERQRMTAIRQLKEANQAVFKKMDAGNILRLSKSYGHRLRLLGANMNDKEKTPGTQPG